MNTFRKAYFILRNIIYEKGTLTNRFLSANFESKTLCSPIVILCVYIINFHIPSFYVYHKMKQKKTKHKNKNNIKSIKHIPFRLPREFSFKKIAFLKLNRCGASNKLDPLGILVAR